MKGARSALFLWLAGTAPLWAARAELIFDGNLVQKTDHLESRGASYLPLKSVANLFKGRTQWYPIADKVVLQVHNQKVAFGLGSRSAAVGNRKFSLEEPVLMVRGTVYAPVSFFVSQNFREIVDCKVSWDESSLILEARSNVTLKAPRTFSFADRLRIVLESEEPLAPSARKDGRLITVDFPKARIASLEAVPLKDPGASKMVLSQARRGVRLTVSLSKSATDYAWSEKTDPHRFILDVFRVSEENVASGEPAVAEDEPLVAGPETPVSSSTVASAPEAPLPVFRPVTSRLRRIVVDAGHGGKDVGALGKGGTKEKDINLLIALELARLLRIEGGYEVLLTRQDDTFIPLHDRSGFANKEKADLFISIHCNASIRRKEGGFEIYFLSEDASDPHAEETAEFENAVVELEDPSERQHHKAQEILFALARNEFINESSLLCYTVDRAVRQSLGLASRGVKQANFHVLHGVQMPSVLVETAFLTYPPEEQKLRKRGFRSGMVDAILTGVKNYERQLALLGKR